MEWLIALLQLYQHQASLELLFELVLLVDRNWSTW